MGAPRFRSAVRADVPDVVRMLADDALGAAREEYVSPLPAAYYAAFEAIDRDPNNELIVGAIERAREKGCQLLQLTSDKARPDAIRFYESLGFVASHEGLKLRLT